MTKQVCQKIFSHVFVSLKFSCPTNQILRCILEETIGISSLNDLALPCHKQILIGIKFQLETNGIVLSFLRS